MSILQSIVDEPLKGLCIRKIRRSPVSAWPTGSTSICPDNQRKLEAADQLVQLADDAGISLIELAIAFVLRHPAVTSAIGQTL